MKICYIFREKERNAHSIEVLFDTISAEVERRGVLIEKWYRPLNKIKSIFMVRALEADIYHITGDCYYLALFLPWRKTIMTIHDIGMYKNHRKTLKSRLFAWMSFVLPMRVLRMSTVISDLTKFDLVHLLGVNGDKLKVVPNPLVMPIQYHAKEYNRDKPIILQIGTGSHKNLIGLIEAVKGLNCHLDIVGNPSSDLVDKMNVYNISYSVSSNLNNEAIIEKYRNCDILYFASLSEGFGLPILEAQAMGRPLITSITEPTKSVCGDGGLLVDPNDHTAIRESILTLLQKPDIRTHCINKGLENVKKYDLDIIVNSYLELYENLIKSSKSINTAHD